MNKRCRAHIVMCLLNKFFPKITIPLWHTDPYTLLIAVILSARCTDKKVNEITPQLFSMASSPQAMAALEQSTIQKIIKPCGLSPTKSKAIKSLSKILVEKYEGKVPQDIEKLEALPGVGHKTASVVVAQAFKKHAFPIDTHIHRCAKRWGLSSGINVTQTEKDLKNIFPKHAWNTLHLQIIYYGRQFCTARNHQIANCSICHRLFVVQSGLVV